MNIVRGLANLLEWVLLDPAGGQLFILGILVYLAVSTWSVGYVFAYLYLYYGVDGVSWLRPYRLPTSSRVGAVGIWVGLGLLNTIKPYLLTILFLLLDAIIVIISSSIALSKSNHKAATLHAPAVIRAVTVVILLAGNNLWFKFRDLALRNITIPEKNQLRRVAGVDGGFWFALLAEQPEEDPDFQHFIGNPWDLGWRRNLSQVFGSWDCLLPWTQPPRVRRYAKGHLVTDFEMSDAFWEWVSDRRENRSRAAGSGSAVAQEQRETDAAGASIAAETSTATFLPASPSRPLSLPRPPNSPPTRAPHEIPLPLSSPVSSEGASSVRG
ncbi:hypothetical protein diail_1008 [Diaporthe ilicicola]|nr:hypothetical protein diail_1008 [Diaporthe ilicicola]